MPKSRFGLLAIMALAALGPIAGHAQVMTLTARAPICENQSGQSTPNDRVTACTEILALGGLTAVQESNTRLNRAWSYSLEGRMAEARADYDRAVALNPGFHAVYNERALFNLRNGRLDEAIKDYDIALSLAPNAAYSLYGRGLAYLRKGDQPRGDADLAQARRADSNVDEAFRRIGMAPR